MKYSQERKPSTEFRPKQAVLAKLALPHQRTVKDVAAEEGISPATLYHWRQQARLNGGLFPDDGADPESFGLSSAEGWTAREKFTAVIETAPLNESACPARSRGPEALFRTLKYSPGTLQHDIITALGPGLVAEDAPLRLAGPAQEGPQPARVEGIESVYNALRRFQVGRQGFIPLIRAGIDCADTQRKHCGALRRC